MDPKKIEGLRRWLDDEPILDGKTRREHLPECQPSLLAQAVLKLLDAVAPKRD
jgi:hypothetical protein